MIYQAPATALWSDPVRSGVGRFSQRTDLTALVVVLVFGAFANAAGMVGPVVDLQDRLRFNLGQPLWAITTVFYVLAIVVLPVTIVGCAAALSRQAGRLDASVLAVARRFTFALVPIGFAMWLAHYTFHLLTSYDTIVPATQRFSADLGWSGLGEPLWLLSCCRPAADWIPRLEILMLDFGLLLSLYTGFRISRENTSPDARAVRALTPWAVLIVLLFALGVWLVLQPMQMRGTLPAVG